MRLLFLWIVLLLPSAMLAVSPDGVIRGQVFDKATGNGLEGADILFGANQGTITNVNGFFMVRTAAGKTELTFRHIGYKTERLTVQLSDKDTVVLNIGLDYEIANIDQVVVSAGRVEQRLSELTVSMNLIKPEFYSTNHITDAKELINKIPGIEVLDGQASVRGGSGFSYGAGSRVLALIDGLPVIAADAGNIRWQFLPMENISQIEIIKGASSVAYGSSALNGVINFRTADATEKPLTRFYIETGIFGIPSNIEWKWWDTPRLFNSASFSDLRRIGNTDLAIGATVMTDNGYRKLNNGKLGRMNVKLKHKNSHVDGLSYGLSFNGGTTVKTDFILWENAATGALRQQESTAVELHGKFIALDPFVSYDSQKKGKHVFRSRLQLSDNTYPNSDQNDSEAFNFYSEYQIVVKLSGNLSLNGGFSQNLIRVDSRFYGNHRGWNAGAFTQFDYIVTNRLRIASGVRMEHNRLNTEIDKIVPLFRTGLNFRALDFTFIRASFGQGYRFPSVAEKYAATSIGSVKIFPNLYIQPERGWNAEIGAKQGIMSEHLSGMLDFALFYLQNTDMIEYIFGIYPDPGQESYSFGFKAENQEASRVYGFEMQSVFTHRAGRFTNRINGGYTYMYPVEFNRVTNKNTDVMLKYRRRHSAMVNLSSSYRKTEIGIGLYAKSKIVNIDDVFLNELTRESLLPGFYDYWNQKNRGYLLADLNLRYELTRNYSISFAIKNVANIEYMGRPGDIQPHRNFSLRVSGNFN